MSGAGVPHIPPGRFRGADAAPPRARAATSPTAHTPTLDRLPEEARSVVVPAALTCGLVVLGLVLATAACVLVALAVDRSEALDDLDRIDRDLTGAQIRACESRQDALDDARRDHVGRTGRAPDDIDQIEPGARDFVLDRGGHPVPAPGSLCEGVDAGTRTTGRAVADRADAAWADVASSVGTGLLVAAAVALLAALGALSHWLATAYRCLPRAVRHQRPRRAYAVVRTSAVLLPLLTGATILLVAYVAPEAPAAAGILSWILQLGALVVLVRALLGVVSMIGDVTFEFCHRHRRTSRVMRLSVLAWALLPSLAVALVVQAGRLGEPTGWTATILVDGAAVLVAIALVAPFVFAVGLVTAVGMATAGIERALKEAARELERVEAHERVVPAHQPPLGV